MRIFVPGLREAQFTELRRQVGGHRREDQVEAPERTIPRATVTGTGLAALIYIVSAAGVMGVLSAYSKGAPVRILSAETTGAGDLYWYVKSDSPIKSLAELRGKRIPYGFTAQVTLMTLIALHLGAGEAAGDRVARLAGVGHRQAEGLAHLLDPLARARIGRHQRQAGQMAQSLGAQLTHGVGGRLHARPFEQRGDHVAVRVGNRHRHEAQAVDQAAEHRG